MKKLIYAFSALALLFASCSSDSESTPDDTSSAVLVKKIIYQSDDVPADHPLNSTVLFTYQGTKLVRADYSNGEYTTYTYSGDLISSVDFYGEGGVWYWGKKFEYDGSGKLIAHKEHDMSATDEYLRTAYTYNSDNTISFLRQLCDVNNVPFNPEFGTPGILTVADGEVITREITAGPTTSILNYTYDQKNSPFKNVTGFGKIGYEVSIDYEVFGRGQNVVSKHPGSNTEVAYIYNAANYPISSVETVTVNEESTVINAQYFYE